MIDIKELKQDEKKPANPDLKPEEKKDEVPFSV